MEQKNYTEVLIDGRIYTLGGTEEEMYLQKVAAYINEKTGKIKKQEGFSRLSADFQAVMIELNIADDYFKEQERADRLAEQKAALEKEAYSLKHELITTQMKLENMEKELEAEQRKERKLQRAADELKLELETQKAVQAARGEGKTGAVEKADIVTFRTAVSADADDADSMADDMDSEELQVMSASVTQAQSQAASAASAASVADGSDPAAVAASQAAATAGNALETDIVSGQEWSTGKGGSGGTRSARRRK